MRTAKSTDVRIGPVTEYGTAADETMSKDALVKKHPYFSKVRYRCLHFVRDCAALELCADGRFVSLAASLCSRNLQNVRADRDDQRREATKKQPQILSTIHIVLCRMQAKVRLTSALSIVRTAQAAPS